jgi:hypothetical protein
MCLKPHFTVLYAVLDQKIERFPAETFKWHYYVQPL